MLYVIVDKYRGPSFLLSAIESPQSYLLNVPKIQHQRYLVSDLDSGPASIGSVPSRNVSRRTVDSKSGTDCQADVSQQGIILLSSVCNRRSCLERERHVYKIVFRINILPICYAMLASANMVSPLYRQ